MEHGPQISKCTRSKIAEVTVLLKVKGSFLYFARLQVSQVSTVIKEYCLLKTCNLSSEGCPSL